MDLRAHLDKLRADMNEEQRTVQNQIRAAWQELFIQVYALIPDYLHDYVDFSVADEIESANYYPTDSAKGGPHKTIPIRIPDFPPLFLQVIWNGPDQTWNKELFRMQRLGAIELEGVDWVAKYRDAGTYTNFDLDEVLKAALLEREYVNAILDEAERVYPNGKPPRSCMNPQLHHLPSDFPNIQRKIRMK